MCKAKRSKRGFETVPLKNLSVAFLLLARPEPIIESFISAVASTTEDRDVMVNCLQLGAADYMTKPLRLPELRNLWARVYWWRRVNSCVKAQLPH